MEHDAKISVVIPVYNVEQYLAECVDSVLVQNYCNLEIILVDDGATDSSGEICDSYAQRDNRITVIHQTNGGLSAARNTGLRKATGDYVYFLDSDDYILPETFDILINTAKCNSADVVFFDAEVFFTGCEPDPKVYRYERTKEYQPQRGRTMLLELLTTDEYRTAVQLMFFQRRYLEENQLYFMEGILHEDELYTFLVYFANGVFAHCHEKLYQRRMRAGSIMTSSSMQKRFESVLTIYNALEKRYREKEIYGHISEVYLARMSRSVIAKYKMLDDDAKINHQKKYRQFERSVLHNHGFKDMKLKIKCSHGILNIYYRAVNKLKVR